LRQASRRGENISLLKANKARMELPGRYFEKPWKASQRRLILKFTSTVLIITLFSRKKCH